MNWRYRAALFHCTEQDQDGLSFSIWELKPQKREPLANAFHLCEAIYSSTQGAENVVQMMEVP